MRNDPRAECPIVVGELTCLDQPSCLKSATPASNGIGPHNRQVAKAFLPKFLDIRVFRAGRVDRHGLGKIGVGPEARIVSVLDSSLSRRVTLLDQSGWFRTSP